MPGTALAFAARHRPGLREIRFCPVSGGLARSPGAVRGGAISVFDCLPAQHRLGFPSRKKSLDSQAVDTIELLTMNDQL